MSASGTGMSSEREREGKRSTTRLIKKTTGNSRPLAEWTVKILTASLVDQSTSAANGDSPISDERLSQSTTEWTEASEFWVSKDLSLLKNFMMFWALVS